MTDRQPYVRYWLEASPDKIGNFGDYLTRILLDYVFDKQLVEADVYHLVGSVIDEGIMRDGLLGAGCDSAMGTVAFWGCGMREDVEASPWLLEHGLFFGVRGPASRDRLKLPLDTVLGDPGLVMPLIRPGKLIPRHGQSLCLLHHLDPIEDEVALQKTGADLVRRATIPATSEGFFTLLDCIAGAKFVLSGALHGAIAAFAYGVPFAYLDLGYVDCPFKWQDFSESIGISPRFADTVTLGHQIYQSSIKPHAVAPSPLPLLQAAPFSLRPSFEALLSGAPR